MASSWLPKELSSETSSFKERVVPRNVGYYRAQISTCRVTSDYETFVEVGFQKHRVRHSLPPSQRIRVRSCKREGLTYPFQRSMTVVDSGREGIFRGKARGRCEPRRRIQKSLGLRTGIRYSRQRSCTARTSREERSHPNRYYRRTNLYEGSLVQRSSTQRDSWTKSNLRHEC